MELVENKVENADLLLKSQMVNSILTEGYLDRASRSREGKPIKLLSQNFISL